MDDGLLVPNADAALILRVFRMRAKSKSQRAISDETGLHYSTVRQVLHNRAYLGEVKYNDEWFAGIHDPLVTEEEWAAAHRGYSPGRGKTKDLLSGKVVCDLCGRKMSLDQNGQGQRLFGCKHRGSGCKISRRSSGGLLRGARKALNLVGSDQSLQEAIREQVRQARTESDGGANGRDAELIPLRKEALENEQRNLLRLHYLDAISEDLYLEEQKRITRELARLRAEEPEAVAPDTSEDDFEQLVAAIAAVDLDHAFELAAENERRILIDELIESVNIGPEHFSVKLFGSPPVRIRYGEVGLKDSDFAGVGGANTTLNPRHRSRWLWSWAA